VALLNPTQNTVQKEPDSKKQLDTDTIGWVITLDKFIQAKDLGKKKVQGLGLPPFSFLKSYKT
jgi:hypothetical protein